VSAQDDARERRPAQRPDRRRMGVDLGGGDVVGADHGTGSTGEAVLIDFQEAAVPAEQGGFAPDREDPGFFGLWPREAVFVDVARREFDTGLH
jgi:hypothetical protein